MGSPIEPWQGTGGLGEGLRLYHQTGLRRLFDRCLFGCYDEFASGWDVLSDSSNGFDDGSHRFTVFQFHGKKLDEEENLPLVHPEVFDFRNNVPTDLSFLSWELRFNVRLNIYDILSLGIFLFGIIHYHLLRLESFVPSRGSLLRAIELSRPGSRPLHLWRE